MVRGYKFGVLYVKAGQKEEDDMYANGTLTAITRVLTFWKVETSIQFEEFLKFLGDEIELQGWTSFRGGLDVKCKNSM